eukprot:CAMPEP_0184389672 /NCGR_PEP_ID=MMETSP0007-20130409/12690_1 /TAXON_ID=97485 /ORGANISM="Prymnesium parvum, Strain Texoma1" /LENGTH=260 /DNA_ID=CAMNT_0026739109 /DNA_START=9 /DNA_END=788 /DNA_ORIENTATION=+
MSSIVEAASNLMSPSAPPPSSPSLPVLPPSALLSSLSPLPPTQKAPAYPHRPRSYAVVNEINARWQHGTPSNNLSSAGVMLHLFDDYEDKANGRPWRMCRREQCPSQIEIDHLSCSVVNAQRPAIFPGGAAEGIILSADAQFLCAYSKDVGSGAASYRGGCNGKQTRQGYYKLPHTLQGAMEEQSAMAYNEVIVGRTWWEQHLPHNVAAVLVLKWRATPKGPQLHNDSQARMTHSSFLREYSLSSEQVPLLRYTWNPYLS